MKKSVIVLWQEFPERLDVVIIRPETEEEYNKLVGFNRRFINADPDCEDIYAYFYDVEHNFKFEDERNAKFDAETNSIKLKSIYAGDEEYVFVNTGIIV